MGDASTQPAAWRSSARTGVNWSSKMHSPPAEHLSHPWHPRKTSPFKYTSLVSAPAWAAPLRTARISVAELPFFLALPATPMTVLTRALLWLCRELADPPDVLPYLVLFFLPDAHQEHFRPAPLLFGPGSLPPCQQHSVQPRHSCTAARQISTTMSVFITSACTSSRFPDISTTNAAGLACLAA